MDKQQLMQRKKQRPEDGFSFIELMIIAIIIGILSSMSYISLSGTIDSERLKSTTRDMENWINKQRDLAMQNGLTCKIAIDAGSLILSSEALQLNAAAQSKPCDPNLTSLDTFNIKENYEKSKSNLMMTITTATTRSNASTAVAEILFSFRGFSENTTSPVQGGELEMRLSDANVKTTRCIKIISPIGLIRDGYKSNSTTDCTYINPY